MLAEELLAFAEDERAIRFINREKRERQRGWETLVDGGCTLAGLWPEFFEINEENKRDSIERNSDV